MSQIYSIQQITTQLPIVDINTREFNQRYLKLRVQIEKGDIKAV